MRFSIRRDRSRQPSSNPPNTIVTSAEIPVIDISRETIAAEETKQRERHEPSPSGDSDLTDDEDNYFLEDYDMLDASRTLRQSPRPLASAESREDSHAPTPILDLARNTEEHGEEFWEGESRKQEDWQNAPLHPNRRPTLPYSLSTEEVWEERPALEEQRNDMPLTPNRRRLTLHHSSSTPSFSRPKITPHLPRTPSAPRSHYHRARVQHLLGDRPSYKTSMPSLAAAGTDDPRTLIVLEYHPVVINFMYRIPARAQGVR